MWTVGTGYKMVYDRLGCVRVSVVVYGKVERKSVFVKSAKMR